MSRCVAVNLQWPAPAVPISYLALFNYICIYQKEINGLLNSNRLTKQSTIVVTNRDWVLKPSSKVSSQWDLWRNFNFGATYQFLHERYTWHGPGWSYSYSGDESNTNCVATYFPFLRASLLQVDILAQLTVSTSLSHLLSFLLRGQDYNVRGGWTDLLPVCWYMQMRADWMSALSFPAPCGNRGDELQD